MTNFGCLPPPRPPLLLLFPLVTSVGALTMGPPVTTDVLEEALRLHKREERRKISKKKEKRKDQTTYCLP